MICEPSKMHNGITRDFLRRYLIVRDYFWWDNLRRTSPWAINLVHDGAPTVTDPTTGEVVEPYKPSYWRDRVLDLCEYEITHQCFGLGFNDLMNLDPATLEDIEERVHRMATRQNENMQQLSESTKTNNLLKDVRK